MPRAALEERAEELARSALHHWALGNAELRLLAHRENIVFQVTLAGRRYALRVHRPGYHGDDALRSELQWLRALSNAGMDVPAVVPTRTGELLATALAAGTPQRVQLDLFEWIDGEQLGVAQAAAGNDPAWIHETWSQLGALAAAVHAHSAAWQPPPGFTRPTWDENGLAGEDPVWGRSWEQPSLSPGRRALLLAAHERVHRDLAALPKDAAGYGLIHADLLPENVLVDGGRVRLIDFDDSGFGWHLFDLVTPLWEVGGEPWSALAREALLAGYRSRRPLDEAWLDRLPLFLLARALTDVAWMHTRAETETARRSTHRSIASACELAEAYLER